MTNLSDIVSRLQMERSKVHGELARLDAAIQALQEGGGNSTRPHSRRPLSAAARRKISLAQKARWAKQNGGKQSKSTGKRLLSPLARKKIADAQKARWANWRAQKQKAA